MIKYICDRCGSEITGRIYNIVIREEKRETGSILEDYEPSEYDADKLFAEAMFNSRSYCERCKDGIRKQLEKPNQGSVKADMPGRHRLARRRRKVWR